jgi:hypothetical protein
LAIRKPKMERSESLLSVGALDHPSFDGGKFAALLAVACKKVVASENQKHYCEHGNDEDSLNFGLAHTLMIREYT